MDNVLQFRAVAILQVHKRGEVLDHDGKPYKSPDFKFGTVFAVTKEGHMLCPSSKEIGEFYSMKSMTPRAGILFRDYWYTVACKATVKDEAPYYKALQISEFKLRSGKLPEGHILNIVK